MTTTQAPRAFPAFRITRGDQVRHANRTVTVTAVQPVVFISRHRDRPSESGVKLSLRSVRGARFSVSLRNSDTIVAYR